MEKLFVWYPKCGTCRKAKKWLAENGVEVAERLIAEDNPTEEELRKWIEMSGQPVKKFFNTSGQVYRSMGLKDKLKDMSDDEKIALLASDGMLVKRPILVTDDKALVGFKEADWESLKQQA
ncbi:MAG: arsenate reductase family protein [Erysipelotrichaceae bacterium]|nr:arsenate reductase family protein [Erysipelotrichaceae bacterium]